MTTKTYTLLSGVEVEAHLITGKHQELFAQQGSRSKVLAELITRIGDKTNLSKEDVKKMLPCDANDLLMQLRMDSISEEMDFDLEWRDEEGQPFKHTHRLILTEGGYNKQAPAKAISSYEELPETYEVTLPTCGKTVNITRMTVGLMEAQAKKMEASKINLNTLLRWQHPRFVEKDAETGKERLVKVEVGDLIARDVEHLRKAIAQEEGKFLATHTFKHPHNPMLGEQLVDVMGSTSFLFPSL